MSYDRSISTTLVREAQAQVTDEGRLCFKCREWKTWDKFNKNASGLRGKHSRCVSCVVWMTRCNKYGVTRAELQYLMDSQNNVCAICFEPEDVKQKRGSGNTWNLSVDHDHQCCGQRKACKKCIRGLLCANCNDLIGRVEKRQILRAMFAVYLNARPLLNVVG